MKLIYSSALLLAIVGLAQAVGLDQFVQVMQLKQSPNDNHPGKCVLDDIIVSPGQTIKHPTIECAEFTCDDSDLWTTIKTCVPMSMLPPPRAFNAEDYGRDRKPTCKWDKFDNTEAPFPECCERGFSCVL